MDADEIARRLQAARERIREQLAERPPPTVAEEAPADPELKLDEFEGAPPAATEPGLNTTDHLEAANRLEAVAAPIDLSSGTPVLGPLLTLLRRLVRPLVRPFVDPFVARQERFNAEIVRHLNELGSRLETRMSRVADDAMQRARDPRLLEARLEASLSSYDHALRQRHTVLLDALEEELWSLQNLVRDGAGQLDGRLNDFEVRFVERAQAVDRRFDEKDRALKSAMATGSAGASEAELQATRAALGRTLEEVAAARAAVSSASDAPGERELQSWETLRSWLEDDDYQAFQDRFRGDESAILDRMREHVEHFAGVRGPVADLGCGRGEFLELLEQAGVQAIGIEINTADVESCVRRGLTAVEADLFEWLAEQQPGSLGGIFLAQVIEHLPPRDWARFMRLASTRLEPGGVLLVETINPESLYAFARAYVIDPTHTRPAHPELIAFLAARNGFDKVRIHLQALVPDEQRIPRIQEEPYRDDERTRALVNDFNDRLTRLDRVIFAPQEYALVARRAEAGEAE